MSKASSGEPFHYRHEISIGLTMSWLFFFTQTLSSIVIVITILSLSFSHFSGNPTHCVKRDDNFFLYCFINYVFLINIFFFTFDLTMNLCSVERSSQAFLYTYFKEFLKGFLMNFENILVSTFATKCFSKPLLTRLPLAYDCLDHSNQPYYCS